MSTRTSKKFIVSFEVDSLEQAEIMQMELIKRGFKAGIRNTPNVSKSKLGLLLIEIMRNNPESLLSTTDLIDKVSAQGEGYARESVPVTLSRLAKEGTIRQVIRSHWKLNS